jgi:hypothetical protein
MGVSRDSGQCHRLGRLPLGVTVLGDDGGVDAAAHVEVRGQPHEAWLGDFDQVIQDAIGHRLVKGTFVTERPDVEFERLQFHTALIRHVFELERGEIGLTGLGTQAGELRHVDADGVIPRGHGVIEGFEVF